jgi:hypothetical protein
MDWCFPVAFVAACIIIAFFCPDSHTAMLPCFRPVDIYMLWRYVFSNLLELRSIGFFKSLCIRPGPTPTCLRLKRLGCCHCWCLLCIRPGTQEMQGKTECLVTYDPDCNGCYHYLLSSLVFFQFELMSSRSYLSANTYLNFSGILDECIYAIL